MKKLLLSLILLITTLAPVSVSAAAIDTPHNQTNGISCSHCHTYSAWWQYSPANKITGGYSNLTSVICLSCHGASGPAPIMLRHDSDNLSKKHDIWSTACVDCHDPHQQDQLSWRSTDYEELFLVTGLIATIDNGDGTFSYSFEDNGDGTTTINIDHGATLADNGWDTPEQWHKKNDNQHHNRGLIFVHSTSEAYNTYPILSATSTSITVRGTFEAAEADPAKDATFGLIYGQLIRSSIMARTVVDPSTYTPREVKFFNPLLQNTIGGYTDQETTRKGICQICHIKTDKWTENGLNDGHNANLVCTTCHLREDAFKQNGTGGHSDGDDTFAWDSTCQDCHQPLGTEEILADVHRIGTKNTCSICHQTSAGGMPLVGDAAKAAIGTTPHLCSECHTDLYTQHHSSSSSRNGDCTWCHTDPRPDWQNSFGVTGSAPRQLACRECHVKPDGTGLVVYKLDFPVTHADTISFPGGNLSLPPDNAKSVIQIIMDGTNGTTNHGISGPAKIDIYDFGACLSCHDGTIATGVNVWHARPKYSEIPTDSSTDAYRMHFDTLRYAPGRSKFNLWRGDGYQSEPYFSHRNDHYDDGDYDAATRGAHFFDDQNGRNYITWNWGRAADPFTMVQIPCFANAGSGNDKEGLCGDNSAAANELVPVFDNGPARDQIQAEYALFGSGVLRITAVNTNGELSITYDDVNYGTMTGTSGSSWSMAIPLAYLTANTVDIVTSNPLGTSLYGFPICPDPITVQMATWNPNGSVLTVLAQSTSASAGAMTVSNYAGTDFPMTNTEGTSWQFVQYGLPYQDTITVSGDCAGLSFPVTDLTDVITITRAEWDPAQTGAELVVWAQNTTSSAHLMVDYATSLNNPMIWNSELSRWELALSAPEFAPEVRVHSDYYGDNSESVVSLGETILFARAQHDELTGTVSIQAINQQGSSSQVHVVYNGSTIPLTHAGGNRWELKDHTVFNHADDITIWSTAGAYSLALVNECSSPSWPPPSAGTLLDAGSSWVRSGQNPDRLRITVNIGRDGGLPKVRLNGSGTPVDKICSPHLLTGVYRCDFEDNELYAAGHDNWVVAYTGVYPGDKSVTNYQISDWSIDQLPLQPVQVSLNGLPNCQDYVWDNVTHASAVWDGSALSIHAENTWGNSTLLQTEYASVSHPLDWDSAASAWKTTVSGVPFEPFLYFWSEAGAGTTVPVADFTASPDTITLLDAGWNADNAGTLTASAINTYDERATLTAHYNGASTPLTWTGSQWELQNISGISLPSDITITSNAPGGGSTTPAPIADRTPDIYPPACNSNNGMDQIIEPFEKSHFDPDKNNELHVQFRNVINQSYGAHFFMTYSETVAEQTVYPVPWDSPFTFEFFQYNFTWSPGATVTVWSLNDQGQIMDVACNQPVLHKNMNDTITITRAEWDPATNQLLVWAENSAAETTQLYLDYDTLLAQPMSWDDTHNRWQITLKNVPYFNVARIFSDANGDTTGPVLDLNPDAITIQSANWKAGTTSGTLALRVTNYQGGVNQLYIDYGTITGQPLSWDNDTYEWKLLMEQVAYAVSVRVWSLRPGETTGAVTDMTGTHLNLTADSQCLACHPSSDIVFTIHLAACSACHASTEPAVQDSIATGQGGSCITCHNASSNAEIRVAEIRFNYSGSAALALKDHERPNSDILVPVPEYLLGVRSEPAAYPKNSAINLEVIFHADPGIDTAVIRSDLLDPQFVTFTNGVSSPVLYTMPPSVSVDPGKFYHRIDWSYCDLNGTYSPACSSPQEMHKTSHTIYITHAPPAAQGPFFTKLVELSTQWSADAADEQEIVDAIFDGIWTLGAYGYTYQFPFLARTGTRIGDILRYQAGACGEWAAFLQRALGVQGVDVYVVDIVADDRDNLVVISEAIGAELDSYLFGDHAFVVHGVPYIQSVVPTLGTAYDPTFHQTGPGWGGYEDVLIPYLEEHDRWYLNDGYGNGTEDDVLNTQIREVIDDFIVDESQL